ncbi:Cation/H(+) antiporter 18 [Vitis vinifera]|uniref:Cation/H(+) antiporter 18 n=1 Tax=Vitis vinifera TaxID=29760 RepID=A0A438J5H8_VITVI|nr:Cation/H(+) antiporter 18 [Vitis vinifera]
MATNVTCHRPPPTKATSNGVFEGDNPIHFGSPSSYCADMPCTCGYSLSAFLLKPLREPRVVAEIIGEYPNYICTGIFNRVNTLIYIYTGIS